LTQIIDVRAPSDIGRAARLELVFERHGGRTRLARQYVEPPFRIGACLDLHGAAYVIVACTGPGAFAGDRLQQTVRLEPGAQVVLASQSALRLHPSAAPSPAQIVHEYDIGDEAELYAHWDPTIPFEGSRVDQRFEIRAAETGHVYWSDALMAGRVARGETWCFSALAHELRLTRGSALAYLERYRLQPRCVRPSESWRAGPANYLSTSLAVDPRASSAHAEAMQRRLSTIAGVSSGVDAVEAGLIVARLAAREGPSFAAAREVVRDLALQLIFGRANLTARK